MLGSMGLSEGEADMDETKIAEAQKMFEECVTQIQKDTKDSEAAGASNVKPKETKPANDGLGGLGDMFKDFERIAQEQKKPAAG